MKNISAIVMVFFFVLTGCDKSPEKNAGSEEVLRKVMKGKCSKARTYDEIKRGVPCKKD